MDVTARPVDFGKLHTGSLPMEDIRIAYGGDALNEAVVLRRLGAHVELISSVGQDETGDRLVRFLEKEGISGAGINRAADAPTNHMFSGNVCIPGDGHSGDGSGCRGSAEEAGKDPVR